MESYRAPSYRTLASLSRINLLYQLQQGGTMTVGDLAEAVGLHPNTTREHLHRLIDEGFVTCEPEQRDTKGRPRMLYTVANGADVRDGSVRAAKIEAALRRADQLRRLLPIESLAYAASPLRRQLDVLEDHLDRTGFDSHLTADGLHMHLYECPYSDLVKAHPEVCSVHFGLLQGVLDQADGPLEAHELHPLSEPDTCTLDLHSTQTAAAPKPLRVPAIIIHGVSAL